MTRKKARPLRNEIGKTEAAALLEVEMWARAVVFGVLNKHDYLRNLELALNTLTRARRPTPPKP